VFINAYSDDDDDDDYYGDEDDKVKKIKSCVYLLRRENDLKCMSFGQKMILVL
jgi:hypothetical protein